MKLNEQKTLIYLNSLSNDKKQKFLELGNNVITALKINPELQDEVIKTLENEFPGIKNCLE